MFANIKAKLLKVDLRKGGKKVFVFETSVRMSAGELDAIAEMIDQDVVIGLDAQVISYRIRKNAETNESIVSYKVDDSGVVTEYKPEGSQAEMDLGIPVPKPQIVEEDLEISRSVVNEFIIAGLAQTYEDLEYEFPEILKRNSEGESYLRIASELELSSGKLAEILEEYSRRIAPLAAKWDEWRQGNVKAVDKVIKQSQPTVKPIAETNKEFSEQESVIENDPMAGVGDDQEEDNLE